MFTRLGHSFLIPGLRGTKMARSRLPASVASRTLVDDTRTVHDRSGYAEYPEDVYVGVPTSESNIRPIRWISNHGRSMEGKDDQAAFYQDVEQIWRWHHEFWMLNNRQFEDALTRYKRVEASMPSSCKARAHGRDVNMENKSPLDDDDSLAPFYHQVLVENKDMYREYQKKWHKDLTILLYLAAKNSLYAMYHRFIGFKRRKST